MRRLIVLTVAALAAVLIPDGMRAAAAAPDPEPADSAGASVSADLPVPDGTVLYVRYGEPGAVRILRRVLTGDSLSLAQEATVDAMAPAVTEAMARAAVGAPGTAAPAAPAAPAGAAPPDLATRVRAILREEIRAAAQAPPAGAYAAPAPGAAAPAPGTRPGWLDSPVGTGLPLGSAAPDRSPDGREWVVTTPRTATGGGTAPGLALDVVPGPSADSTPGPAGGTSVTAAVVPVPTRTTITESMMKDGLFRTNVILFETLRAELLPRSREVLDVVAGILRDFPDVRMRVEGHADARGDAGANLELSRRRAESVRSYLVDAGGIAPNRLEAQGFGESRPLETGTSETALALNRRVEFHVLNPEALRRVSGSASPPERNDP